MPATHDDVDGLVDHRFDEVLRRDRCTEVSARQRMARPTAPSVGEDTGANCGGTPAAVGNSGATWHHHKGDQQTRQAAPPARSRAAAPVRDRMDREYAQPLDVEALARGVNMWAGHLSRQFKIAASARIPI